MNLQEAVLARHSVRSYEKRSIDGEILRQLQEYIDDLNARSGLHMQMALGDSAPFSGLLHRIGWLAGVENYLVIVGPDGPGLEEKAGYYGEAFVLRAQQLGLNSCWVGGTYNKGKCRAEIAAGERMVLAIAFGYGKNQGKGHRTKALDAVCIYQGSMPDWFRRGAEMALLAPTALNQQAFRLELTGEKGVRAVSTRGALALVDLGIVKYHFEIGAGEGDWTWTD